jgi:hypothetical protein
MEVDAIYSLEIIKQMGLFEERSNRENAKVFIKGDKVYFFEQIDSEHLRLYTIINKKSFFL